MTEIQKQPHYVTAVKLLGTIYSDIDARRVSLDERKRLEIEQDCFVYGEINYTTFSKMLEIAKPKPGNVFYDLGSGSGKAVLLASLLYDFSKCYGVEYLQPLYQLSVDQLNKLKQQEDYKREFADSRVEVGFKNDDLFNFDVSDANIVYVNATCFIGEIWERTVEKLTSQLEVGARVMLCTKSLPDSHYDHLFSELLEMSWGPCTINVFKKIA